MTAELVTLKCHEHIRTQTDFCTVFLGFLKAKAIKKNSVFHDSYTGCAKVTIIHKVSPYFFDGFPSYLQCDVEE